MSNILDRLSEVERRLSFIEEQLGFVQEKENTPQDKPVKKTKQEKEEEINGFSKDQLRIMFSWAKNTKLQLISKGDFEELKRWGMLKDFYPDAPDNYEDIIM